MRELLNTLYVLTQGAVLRLDHDAVTVQADNERQFRAPLLSLAAIVVFGRVTVTPFVIARCAEDGRSLVWLDRNGRFKARLEGPTRGNVLLRRAQHLALSDPSRPLGIARQIVAAKIQNSRQVLLRGVRETSNETDAARLAAAADRLGSALVRLPVARTLNEVRGVEGEAARAYFSGMPALVRSQRPDFETDGRTKRPPRDRMNAVLSFLYALLRSECASALEGVGLDPQVGYLHSLRPGRPALALDLMEELRPAVADRLALALVNRRQLQAGDFEAGLGGAVNLTDGGRRVVLAAYERRKQTEVKHRVLRETIPLGLVPHVQARLLARHLRGDLPHYPPFQFR